MPNFLNTIWIKLSLNSSPFKGYENPEELQDEIRLHFKVYSDTPLPDLRITPKQYFASNYAKNVPNRQPLYNLRNSDPYYADTYHDYISFMTDCDA